MRIPQLPINIDTIFECDLLGDDGEPFDASAADEVKVTFVDVDRTEVLVGPITADDAYTGADWAGGIIPVPVDATDTDAIDATVIACQVNCKFGSRYRVFLIDKIAIVRSLDP